MRITLVVLAALGVGFATLVSCSGGLLSKESDPYSGRAPWVAAGGAIMSRVSKQLCSEYDMRVMGSGGKLMKNIEELSLIFEVRRCLTRDEARLLLVTAVETLIAEMNQDERARPFLADFPASVANVQITIVIHDLGGQPTSDPDIGAVATMGDQVVYLTFDPEPPNLILKKTQEAYHEAKEKVANH